MITTNTRSWVLLACFGVLAVGSFFLYTADPSTTADVEIRRTTDGIPHIKARNWFGAGYGYGYVQAEDALCTLAEAFVTYRGERSRYWGGEARPQFDATFGRAPNLELDIFFRRFIDGAVVTAYRAHQSDEIVALVEGFAAGYNRYVTSTDAGGRECTGKPWLTPITADDVYRRMYAAGLAGGYAYFLPQIVNAQPPAVEPVSEERLARDNAESNSTALQARFASRVGEHPALGSNVLAFGEQATGEAQSVLFGNPHWYWAGPDRFYQAHLTIPGTLNVAGVSFLGVPFIMIGFNDHVAWSHTVSTARRYGLAQLNLVAGDPTAYHYDGKRIPMQQQTVVVPVRGDKGEIDNVSRTLYSSQYGPVIDFGAAGAALGWRQNQVLAVRDINADNFRIFETYLRWAQAQSLEEFVAIQRDTSAIPWVNTAAIGRDSGRVWFSDIGRVPFITDDLRERCAGDLAPVFSRLDPVAPLLDGSRSACNWLDTGDRSMPGAMPPERLPALYVNNYVANMNDSYWLTQPGTPIEGLDLILGGEALALSLRGQAGHRLAHTLSAKKMGSAQALSRALRTAVLDAKAYSAVRFKDTLLSHVCTVDTVTVRGDIMTGAELDTPNSVAIDKACRVLGQWSGGGSASDQGSLLWEMWWQRLSRIPTAEFYLTPFSSGRPLTTPAQPNGSDPRVAEALGAAVLSMQAKGWALDIPRGEVFSVTTDGQALGLDGGCSSDGYFVVVCSRDNDFQISPVSYGNSYLQLVSFGDGVEAYTLMAHGQDERALSGGPGSEPVQRYVDKQWLRLPFTEAEIADDPAVRRTVLRFREHQSSAREPVPQ